MHKDGDWSVKVPKLTTNLHRAPTQSTKWYVGMMASYVSLPEITLFSLEICFAKKIQKPIKLVS